MPSLMTGLFPSFEGVQTWTRATHHGFNDWESEGERERFGLSDNLRTLAEILQRRRLHHRRVQRPTRTAVQNPTSGRVSTSTSSFYHIWHEVRAERSHALIGNYPPATVVMNKVLRRLQQGFEQPAFIWTHLTDVHSPTALHERFLACSGRDPTDFSDLEINESMYHLRSPAWLAECRGALSLARFARPQPRGVPEPLEAALYEAEIRYCDHQLGRFFDALWADSMWDDTLVLVTADHGEEFLDHGYVAHHVITGLAEELIHIPAVLKLTRVGRPAGRRSASWCGWLISRRPFSTTQGSPPKAPPWTESA